MVDPVASISIVMMIMTKLISQARYALLAWCSIRNDSYIVLQISDMQNKFKSWFTHVRLPQVVV